MVYCDGHNIRADAAVSNLPSRRRSSAISLVLLAGITILPPLSAAPASAAKSVAQLRSEAAALRVKLEQLEIAQAIAVEKYGEASESLRLATYGEMMSKTTLSDQKVSAVAAGDRSARRMRAIYQSGGPLGLTVSMFNSTNFEDAAVRWHTIENLVDADKNSELVQQLSVQSQTRDVRSAALSRAQVTAKRQTEAAAAEVIQKNIAEQQKLIATADKAVVDLMEQERKAAEAKALAEAAEKARALSIGGFGEVFGQGLEGATAADQTLPKVAAPNGIAAAAIQAAATKIGRPYVWGATGPDSFDCSGLMMWSYAQAGVSIPRTSRAQYAGLTKVPLTELAPGDLVFYARNSTDPGSIYHVGMYIGNGLTLYAPRTGSNVKIGPAAYGTIFGAVRPTALVP